MSTDLATVRTELQEAMSFLGAARRQLHRPTGDDYITPSCEA
jgi:hypothetical protein